MADPIRLAAVVVTHNRRAQIEVTLARLLAEPVDHVVVVDNCSTDGTGDWLAAQTDPRLCLLRPERNLGGAGGFEAGMRAAVARFDPDWLVVMDDDARPRPGTMARFRATDLRGWDAAAAAVFYPAGQVCDMNRPALNPFWHRGTFLRTLMGGGRMGFHMADADYDPVGAPRPVDAASFVGLFLSRGAIARAGYPDGQLFIYADDTLYTMQLTRAGGRIGFFPALAFEHDCSTLGANEARVYSPIWKVYYTYRNGLLMYRYAAGVWFWLVLPVVVGKWAWRGRLYGPQRGRYFQLLRHAVADALWRRLDRGVPDPAD